MLLKHGVVANEALSAHILRSFISILAVYDSFLRIYFNLFST